MDRAIKNTFIESSDLIKNSISLIPEIKKATNEIIKCIKKGNKVVIFGNGGSAADAQHTAAELIGRFQLNRKSYPAIALTTDTSIITSLGNDYSFDLIFSRQCESLVSQGDVVIGISTSGRSTNIRNGLMSAKKKGATTVGLLGSKGGTIKNLVDIAIIVDSSSTPRVQEVHRTIYHIICERIEKNLIKKR